jgi:hypothetical protein
MRDVGLKRGQQMAERKPSPPPGGHLPVQKAILARALARQAAYEDDMVERLASAAGGISCAAPSTPGSPRTSKMPGQ